MEAISDTVLQFGYRVWQVKPPTPSLIVIVKATFDLVPDGPCVLSETQDPCGGDCHHDDEEELSLRVEQDFAILKPRGECFVTGACFAPKEQPLRELTAGFRIGPVEKTFRVFGDRCWEGTVRVKPSEAIPFTVMPLMRERAFGGPGHKTNRWGIGYKGYAPAGVRQLPNFERPESLVTSTRSKPEPLVTTATPMGERSRLKLAGTYNQRYMRSRWPYFPEDFNWDFFLGAPRDQQINGYWRGDEELVLFNMHRSHATLQTRLPSIRPRAFLHRAPASGVEDFTEVPLALDTITVDTEREKALCLWRGLTDVLSEDLDDIQHLFYMHEEAGSRAHVPDLYARFLVRKHEEDMDEEDEAGSLPADVSEGGARDAPTPLVTDDDDATLVAGDDAETLLISDDADETFVTSVDDAVPADDEEAASEAQLQALVGNVPPPPSQDPPSPQSLKEQLLASGFPVPPEVITALDEAAEEEPESEEDVAAEPPDVSARERFMQMVAASQSLDGEVFENVDLTGLDLAGEDLSGVVLVSATLSEANLRGADLSNAQLSECTLAQARLDKARLVDADLSGCAAQGATFLAAVLEGATLDECQLDGCDLRGVHGVDASFARASLPDARLSEASLVRADFAGAALERADFSRSNLQDATFEGVRAADARFDGANLTSLRAAESADFSRCSLRGVTAPGALWDDANLREADLTASDLTGAFFTGALMFRTTLDRCRARGGTFEKANLSHASLKAADLFQADLESTDLSFTDFTGANLFGAEVWKARLDGTCFTRADVRRTKIGVLET